MISRRFCRVLLLLLSSICICAPAQAWGGRGHRITAFVAEALLNDAARLQVHGLLDGEGLDIAATFMDEQRETLRQRWPESPRWHYDNRPACAANARYCADGHCATRQIERFREVLHNREAAKEERALALRLLVHMLGDIHQPLHMADNADRGGNDVEVRLAGKTYRLHEVFDTVLITQLTADLSARRYAARLLDRYRTQTAQWQRGTLDDWARDAHTLAVQDVYGGLPDFSCRTSGAQVIELPATYLQRAHVYLPEQLTKAGARIAAVLNQTLAR